VRPVTRSEHLFDSHAGSSDGYKLILKLNRFNEVGEMPAIVTKIPTMKDDDLLNLFHNASQMLSKGQNVDAESVIVAIDREWTARLNRARAGRYSAQTPAIGMLSTLGYHVGTVQGEKTPIRRQILKYLLERQLPMVGSPAYTDEWGAPNSRERYQKLVRFLESFINSPQQQDNAAAIIMWSEDLEWVQTTYAHLVK